MGNFGAAVMRLVIRATWMPVHAAIALGRRTRLPEWLWLTVLYAGVLALVFVLPFPWLSTTIAWAAAWNAIGFLAGWLLYERTRWAFVELYDDGIGADLAAERFGYELESGETFSRLLAIGAVTATAAALLGAAPFLIEQESAIDAGRSLVMEAVTNLPFIGVLLDLALKPEDNVTSLIEAGSVITIHAAFFAMLLPALGLALDRSARAIERLPFTPNLAFAVGPGIVGRLARQLDRSGHRIERLNALEALVMIGGRKAFLALVRCACADGEEHRLEAIRRLPHCGISEAELEYAIVPLLACPDNRVAEAAIRIAAAYCPRLQPTAIALAAERNAHASRRAAALMGLAVGIARERLQPGVLQASALEASRSPDYDLKHAGLAALALVDVLYNADAASALAAEIGAWRGGDSVIIALTLGRLCIETRLHPDDVPEALAAVLGIAALLPAEDVLDLRPVIRSLPADRVFRAALDWSGDVRIKTRRRAIRLLVMLASGPASTVLAELARSDPNALVREEAAAAARGALEH